MTRKSHLICYRRSIVYERIGFRPGEKKLGEALRFLDGDQGLETLAAAADAGVRYALLGVPEYVGPMANHGRCCTDNAWDAFLSGFLNMQSNRFLSGATILCLGHVEAADLHREIEAADPKGPGYLEGLRRQVSRLDARVAPVVEWVVRAGLKPVVIGGGHNNAYPLLKGTARGLNASDGIDCLNVDPHADLRPLEGRHSGNSFSYASKERFLRRYFVFGLQEAYNTETVLGALDRPDRIGYTFFEPGGDVDADLGKALGFFNGSDRSVGLEIDLDSIAGMPVSAISPSGYSLDQVRKVVRAAADRLHPVYFHLPEGAPRQETPEMLLAGKALALLVHDFVRFDGRNAAPI